MSIRIEPMCDAHLDGVTAVECSSFLKPWSRQSFVDELCNDLAHYAVAVTGDGTVVGYAGVWDVAGEGHITNIAVLPSFRRIGVGSMLMEALIRLANEKNLCLLTLEVKTSNLAAQHLYQKYGFKQIGVRKRYYSDTNEDALIMTRSRVQTQPDHS